MNFITTGTRLDGEVHSDVLYALFQSRSALHDGAVIISRGKIAAAGCFLPLSKNIEIERHMGTRHRAAIGVSEVTDAVAVVVSEETGRINVAYEGEMVSCPDLISLRQILEQTLGIEVQGTSLFKFGKQS
jgi:diadenylate cyclase